MADERTRRIVEECRGMSDDEIIAAYHAYYYDKTRPQVRKALTQMGIAEHEVSEWVQCHIK